MRVRLCALLLAAALAGCGGLSSHQKEAVGRAADSLNRVRSGVDLGVTYQQYLGLILDARVQVDNVSVLLADGPLKKELEETMASYADARIAWYEKIQSHLLMRMVPDHKVLIDKYGLPETRGFTGDLVADPDVAIQMIWVSAKQHHDRLLQLIK